MMPDNKETGSGQIAQNGRNAAPRFVAVRVNLRRHRAPSSMVGLPPAAESPHNICWSISSTECGEIPSCPNPGISGEHTLSTCISST
jgi:hypothetical protein